MYEVNNKLSIIKFVLLSVASSLLVSCAATSTKGTIASLNDIKFVVKEEKVDDSLEKAMASYEKFLKETPETVMTPEALRRLADLKIQKEYEAEDDALIQQEIQQRNNQQHDVVQSETFISVNTNSLEPVVDSASQAISIQTPATGFVPLATGSDKKTIATADGPIADISEGEKAFNERAGKKIDLSGEKKKKTKRPGGVSENDADDLQAAGAKEAIELYKGLLIKYPLFERNDQVLYQLSRAYEETGQIDIAMKTLDQLNSKYPQSRHIDEAQFRRAEYFFTRELKPIFGSLL